jgi:hypothetical protein
MKLTANIEKEGNGYVSLFPGIDMALILDYFDPDQGRT